jgi:nitrate/nitrite transport system ATP-binding protein
MKKFVELHKVGKTYPTARGPAVIVRDFDLEMREGEFVALLGHSGCGKSTVLSMLAGLTDTTHGAIVVAGREVREPGPERAVVFQSPCLLEWLSAIENVLLAVQPAFPKATAAEQREVAGYYLSVVGLGNALHKRPGELSQGMQQRVGIARAFAVAPKMLLLDEPFGMLDSLTRMELQEVLLELLQRDHKTALMVTHDIDEALFMADRIVMMTNGPAATVGMALTTPFDRPRQRADVLEHPDYYPMRGMMLSFLEDHIVHRTAV